MHTCIHTHMLCTHACVHIYIHQYICTRVHKHIHIHTHTHMYAFECTYMHATHSYKKFICTYTHAKHESGCPVAANMYSDSFSLSLSLSHRPSHYFPSLPCFISLSLLHARTHNFSCSSSHPPAHPPPTPPGLTLLRGDVMTKFTGVVGFATHCNTLQYTATHCNTLQHTATYATHCNTLQHTAIHCNTLQHTATNPGLALLRCGNAKGSTPLHTLQHTATHCNTLQHTAIHCNTLQHTWALFCWVLQRSKRISCMAHTATLCNTLHHTATYCITPGPCAAECCGEARGSSAWRCGSWCLGVKCDVCRHVAPLCLAAEWFRDEWWHCNTLQHTATLCNTLQHTATYCNILPQ